MKTPAITSLRGLILAISAICLVSALHAENDNDSKEKKVSAGMLKKYDANKDGMLDSSEEATMKADRKAREEAKKAELLAKYDANKNGKLDDAEKAQMKADRDAMMEKKKAEMEKKKAEKEAKSGKSKTDAEQ